METFKKPIAEIMEELKKEKQEIIDDGGIMISEKIMKNGKLQKINETAVKIEEKVSKKGNKFYEVVAAAGHKADDIVGKTSPEGFSAFPEWLREGLE